MRAFVAIFPPLKIRAAAVTEAREAIRGSAARVRWVRPENVHLTLKFLGDVREEILKYVDAALEEVCATHTPFDVELAELGAFPSTQRARVLWRGVGAGFEELRSLATDLEAALAPLGFERAERPYAPHLTVGRVRGRPASIDLPPDAEGAEFRVRHVELVESTLTPEGAVYETVETFALSKKNQGTS